jgi:hypothetical protein
MGTNSYEYAYDPIGNRRASTHNDTTNTYTANALNQYTAIDEARPTYDADGNMTADGRGWHYAWNCGSAVKRSHPAMPWWESLQ